jgi:hypothetical protein
MSKQVKRWAVILDGIIMQEIHQDGSYGPDEDCFHLIMIT